jgi:predicted ATPase/class 3 adenylate cyclase
MNLPTGTVTFLFTDIEGSTRLWQEQPEAMSIANARHDEILREAIESNHGYVFQIVGDSFSAAFHNAMDGLRAVLAAQRGLNQTSEVFAEHPRNGVEGAETSEVLKLRVRMGLHTGTAEISIDGKYEGYATLASTHRVMSAAHGGQTLLTQTTYDLLQNALPSDVTLHDMGEHRLKDLRAPLRLYQVNAADLPQNFPAIKSLNTLPNNLPVQLTSFIGRERELAEAQTKLASAKLLTLIGPGGTGKTRLSLQIAIEQLHNFKDGVWLVELASISDPVFIVSTIASVFELREVQNIPLINLLVDYLRAKELLLVLDNCEHMVEASAHIADQLLHACPHLKIIASSREALGINGETVYRVPSLKDDEATRLFIERATKAEPNFNLTEDNASFIAQICSRLDGIPLAIELAAARVKLFTPQQIAERLDDRFKLLTGGSRTALPRQQTLRALIDWSYQSLNETEQRALRRLTVFSGGWTFEAAESVVGENEAMDGLLGLVNKSLVNVEEQDGRSRYSFLETIRQYAMEKLVESGDAVAVRDRHLNYVLEFAEQHSPQGMYGAENTEQLDRIEMEHDNLRAAFEWAVSNHPDKALKLAYAVGGFWTVRDHISEARAWCQAILEKTKSIPDVDEDRARVYGVLGWMSVTTGEHKAGRAAAEQARSLGMKTNDAVTVARSYGILALTSIFLGDYPAAQHAATEGEKIARQQGLKSELALILSTRAQMTYISRMDLEQAKVYLYEATELARQQGFRWASSFLSIGLAHTAAALGDIETARAGFKESAEIAQKMGNKRIVYSSQSELAHVLRARGKLDEPLATYKDLLPKWRDLGHRSAVAHELECIAYILIRKEEPVRAATLFGAAEALREAIDSVMTKIEQVEYANEIESLRAGMDEAEFEQAWKKGRAMTMEQAIELALQG